MSAPEITDPPNNLEYLDTDWKLATVYTAFLFPKSQQDAIRLIYKAGKGIGGRAPIIKHPVNWIIDAREELMVRGYLATTDTKLRSSVIKAEIEPIVESLVARGADGSSDPEILEGVRLVLDSAWFRKFFSSEFLQNPITYRNKTIYEPYQEIIKKNPSGDHLKITSLENRLFQLLNEIGYYSHNFQWMMEDISRRNINPTTRGEEPLLEDLLASRNFDAIIETHDNLIPPRFIDKYYHCIENTDICKMDEFFPEKLIKYLLKTTHAGLFIPIPVSILLRSCPYKSSVRPLDCGYILKQFISAWRREERENPI